MDRITLRPLAKVNLGLDVVGKRDDGYHEVRMVMQTLKLHDHMVMEKVEDGSVTMKANLPFLPCDNRNLIIKAIQLMKEEYHIDSGIRVNLKKVIPVAGGMAGGSSDAAAALFGMNLLFQLKLSQERLLELGLMLGADVPFCLMRGTVLAEGIGEKLTCVGQMPGCGVLVVKPRIAVSTRWVYEAYDSLTQIEHPDIDRLLYAIQQQNLQDICEHMGNNLELVTESKYPIITRIKQSMKDMGAMTSLMSGSGPTVFGIFHDRRQAEAAAERFRCSKGIGQVYVTSFYNVKGRVTEWQI